jgi:hypothetical protein
VVAGLALLGTVLVSLLLARSHATQQWALANRRIQAVRAADVLLSAWWQEQVSIPRSASGTIAGDSSMRWRTQLREDTALVPWKLRVVTLSILDAAAETAPPLAVVDVVVNDETESEQGIHAH